MNGTQVRTGSARISREFDTLEEALVIVMEALNDPLASQSPKVQEAIAYLTEVLKRRVAAIFRRFGIDPELAGDFVNDLWVRFLGRKLWVKYDPQRSHRRGPFLFGIMNNMILEWLDRLMDSTITVLRFHDVIDYASDPAILAENDECLDELRKAVATLNTNLRNSLLERFELSPYVTTDGLTRGERFGRTHRAKKVLKRILDERFGNLDF